MRDLFDFEDEIGNSTVNVLMSLFLESQNVSFTKARFNLNQLCLLFWKSCSSIKIQHFSVVIDTFGNTSIKFIQCALYDYNKILRFIIFSVIEGSKSMTEKWSFLRYLFIDKLWKSILWFKEFLKYLIRVVSKTITSF